MDKSLILIAIRTQYIWDELNLGQPVYHKYILFNNTVHDT